MDPGRTRRRGLEAAVARRAERNAYLETQLASGEEVRGRGRHVPLVTDRRIFVIVRRTGDAWEHDALAFDEMESFRRGVTHDERPLVELRHPEHLRITHVPRHRFLWFAWGNPEAPIPHTTTTLAFVSRRDGALGPVLDGLRAANVPEGEPFRVRPEGTRAERTAATTVMPYATRRASIRRRSPRPPSRPAG